MAKRFRCESYNRILDGADKFFKENTIDGEAIIVTASEDRERCSVFIEFFTVRGRDKVEKSVFLPLPFMSGLSDKCIHTIYYDFLERWRTPK